MFGASSCPGRALRVLGLLPVDWEWEVVAAAYWWYAQLTKIAIPKTKKCLLALNIQNFGSKLHVSVPRGQMEPHESMFSTRKRCLTGSLIWKSFTPSPPKNGHFWPIWSPETAIFAPKYAFFGTYRPCWLIWYPAGWLVGSCGAGAVSRKTPIHFLGPRGALYYLWLTRPQWKIWIPCIKAGMPHELSEEGGGVQNSSTLLRSEER